MQRNDFRFHSISPSAVKLIALIKACLSFFQCLLSTSPLPVVGLFSPTMGSEWDVRILSEFDLCFYIAIKYVFIYLIVCFLFFLFLFVFFFVVVVFILILPFFSSFFFPFFAL